MTPGNATRAGLMAAVAVVAALSACNPLATQHGSQSPHPVTVPHPVVTRSTSPSPTPSSSITPNAAPTSATPTVTPSVTPSSSGAGSAAQAYDARILVLVNDARADAGLSPVTESACADGFAQSWAPVIEANGALSHQSLSPILSTCHASTAGENVAYGNVTADQMMKLWMNSPGHRANILDPSFTGIGIGAVSDPSGRWYGVQDFVG